MQIVEILKGIEIIDLALYLKEHEVLVLADMHIGIEDSLVKQGMLVPKFHFKDLVKRVEGILAILEETKRAVKMVVINGDLKHEFGTISDEEWRNTLKMLDYLSLKCGKVVLIKGNHDKILGPIADKRKVLLVDELIIDDILICHGDKLVDIQDGVKTMIIGHDHPAVSIREGVRSEKFKCFLVGKHGRKNLIVQPSMNPLTEGTDATTDKFLSPFLDRNLGNFKVFVVADDVYYFEKLNKLYK